MTRITDMHSDLQAESSGWLLKSPVTGIGYNVPAALTVHCSLSAVTHAPFHASMLRPASQAGPMHDSAGAGEVS